MEGARRGRDTGYTIHAGGSDTGGRQAVVEWRPTNHGAGCWPSLLPGLRGGLVRCLARRGGASGAAVCAPATQFSSPLLSACYFTRLAAAGRHLTAASDALFKLGTEILTLEEVLYLL